MTEPVIEPVIEPSAGDEGVPAPEGLQPLAGGWSGETFLADLTALGGERTVVRIYGGRSVARGPLAPEIDAAVLELVRGLLPVPRVLEVRRGDPPAGAPGLLVTEHLPGVRLELLLEDLPADRQRRVGERLGEVAARLGHMVQATPGLFEDRTLVPTPLPGHLADLESWLAAHEERLAVAIGPEATTRLGGVAARAQDLLDGVRRSCLVHGDLDARNVLVDPDTLEVTGLLDWEFAHAGSPYADLGHLLRRDPAGPDLAALDEGVLAAYRAFMPPPGPGIEGRGAEELRALGAAADLYALVELAARSTNVAPVLAARRCLLAAG